MSNKSIDTEKLIDCFYFLATIGIFSSIMRKGGYVQNLSFTNLLEKNKTRIGRKAVKGRILTLVNNYNKYMFEDAGISLKMVMAKCIGGYISWRNKQGFKVSITRIVISPYGVKMAANYYLTKTTFTKDSRVQAQSDYDIWEGIVN